MQKLQVIVRVILNDASNAQFTTVHPGNISLIKIWKISSFIWLEKCLFLWIFLFYYNCKKCGSHFSRETTNKTNSLNKSQWTRVNLNWNRTDPCAGLCDERQVPARPYPMQARFQLWWRGQTLYSTRPIIGLFYLPH